MKKPRYLTKSRFKLALDCPTKLFYTGKKEFPDRKLDDPFLAALAKGGFQVGELAKCYFPGGVEVEAERGDYDGAVERTNELLRQENVTIFEAAIRFENFFIRVDVLVKKGNTLELIEVKSKSYLEGESAFVRKKGGIDSDWKAYLYDVAFQKHVAVNAFPDMNVQAFLMLADKGSVCPTDGLNQKFRIFDRNGKKGAERVAELTEAELNNRILCLIPVDDVCEQIFDGSAVKGAEMSFAEMAKYYADNYARDEMIETPISRACRECEFVTTAEQEAEGLRSGRKNCWQRQLAWADEDFEEPTILDIWNLHWTKKDKLIAAGKLKMSSATAEDIGVKTEDKAGLSPSERQWMQVEKVRNGDTTAYIDKENLGLEMSRWKFPLHFIDFETAMPAIPFNRGLRPYEGIAFQYSHHIVHEDGTVEHAGEYLNTNAGEFPNFEFVRRLKDELSRDDGSVFRYATHENSYLNQIHRQLNSYGGDVPDRAELCEFIESITYLKDGKNLVRQGERNMIDLWELVKRYYYDPYTKGSNSIKYVLPAILNTSKFLRDRYSKPIYGAEGGIKSLNFTDQTWIEELADGTVRDPYSMLGNVFEGLSDHDFAMLELDDPDERIADGGAAMVTYARLQFEDINPVIRENLRNALLRYCELDTLAMVMIYEGWREMLAE